MTKMSETQRIAILDFHNGVTAKRHTMVIANSSTADVMVREGWASRVEGMARRLIHVTTAGLIAAGVDMDAIHDEAVQEDRRRRVAAARQGHRCVPVTLPTHTFKRGRHGDAFCMVKHAGFICGGAAGDAVHARPAVIAQAHDEALLIEAARTKWFADCAAAEVARKQAERDGAQGTASAPGATTKRDVLRDLYSLRQTLRTNHANGLLDGIEAWVRAQP